MDVRLRLAYACYRKEPYLWLLFELAIFRDASFVIPWEYTAIMIGISLLYFVWMLVAQPKVLNTPPVEGVDIVA